MKNRDADRKYDTPNRLFMHNHPNPMDVFYQPSDGCCGAMAEQRQTSNCWGNLLRCDSTESIAS